MRRWCLGWIQTSFDLSLTFRGILVARWHTNQSPMHPVLDAHESHGLWLKKNDSGFAFCLGRLGQIGGFRSTWHHVNMEHQDTLFATSRLPMEGTACA